MPIAEDPEPRPTEDPFADLVLDDEFVKGATVKEASGRARMLAAKWKRQPPPEPEPWRAPVPEIRRGRFGRKAKRVDPWGRKRKRNWQAPLFIVLAAAVALAALNVGTLRTWFHGDGQDTAAAAAPATQAPETAAPSSAPPTADPKSPTVDHPWAGSPAETWPTGADAIQLPDAKAVGVFGADEVAAQLKLVKDYLVAADLDPKVISGGDPSAALDMLGGKTRDAAEQDLQHPSQDHSPTWWFSRFDPRTAILVGTTVKVQGHMTFEGDGENGVLVHTDFTFVYPLRPGPEPYRAPAPKPSTTGGGTQTVSWVADTPRGDTEVARTIVRKVTDFRFYDLAKYRVQSGKLYVAHTGAESGNTGCDQSDGYFHPQFESQSYDGPVPSPGASMNDPYDRSKPVPGQGDGKCGTSSRT